MSNESKCTSYDYAMEGFDVGVTSVNKENSDEIFYTSECYFISKGCEIISEMLGKPFGTTYRSICDRFEK